jgi:hypothetical protein
VSPPVLAAVGRKGCGGWPIRSYKRLDWGIALGVSACCGAAGYLVSLGYGFDAIAAAAGLTALYLLLRGGKGTCAAVVLVAALSGIPELNIQSLNAHGSFQATDVCVIAVIALGLHGLLRRERRIPRSWRVMLGVASVGLTLAWSQAVLHGVDKAVPLKSALLFGRDFLFFAILLPLAPYILSSRKEITRFVVALAILTTVFSLVLIAASCHLVSPSAANAYQTHTDGSTIRIYTRMQDLVALGFACSFGYVLIGRRRYRRMATISLTVCIAAVILLLTRAVYIGLIVGVVAAAVTWGAGYTRPSAFVRKRLGVIVAALLVVGFAVMVFVPSLLDSAVLQAIVKRFGEGVENLQGQKAGTLQQRENLASFELQLLGGKWLFGLGFLPPSVFYFASLPSGSIRDVDLGPLQAVMTMGVAGAAFIYLPVVATVARIARPLGKVGGRLEWLRLGLYVWLVSLVAGSITLGTLFTETGSLLAAVALGFAIRVDVLERTDEPLTAATPRKVSQIAYSRQRVSDEPLSSP